MHRLKTWEWLLILAVLMAIGMLGFVRAAELHRCLDIADQVISMKDGTIKGYEKLMADVMRLEFDEAHIRGDASWYGPGFHGRPTSNRETFNQEAMTAASRNLRPGTVVRVWDIETLNSVIVRINDWGPVPEARVIDLSRRAARELGFIRRGVIKVALQVLWEPMVRGQLSGYAVFRERLGMDKPVVPGPSKKD
jgi:rare lipoprotein A